MIDPFENERVGAALQDFFVRFRQMTYEERVCYIEVLRRLVQLDVSDPPSNVVSISASRRSTIGSLDGIGLSVEERELVDRGAPELFYMRLLETFAEVDECAISRRGDDVLAEKLPRAELMKQYRLPRDPN